MAVWGRAGDLTAIPPATVVEPTGRTASTAVWRAVWRNPWTGWLLAALGGLVLAVWLVGVLVLPHVVSDPFALTWLYAMLPGGPDTPLGELSVVVSSLALALSSEYAPTRGLGPWWVWIGDWVVQTTFLASLSIVTIALSTGVRAAAQGYRVPLRAAWMLSRGRVLRVAGYTVATSALVTVVVAWATLLSIRVGIFHVTGWRIGFAIQPAFVLVLTVIPVGYLALVLAGATAGMSRPWSVLRVVGIRRASLGICWASATLWLPAAILRQASTLSQTTQGSQLGAIGWIVHGGVYVAFTAAAFATFAGLSALVPPRLAAPIHVVPVAAAPDEPSAPRSLR